MINVVRVVGNIILVRDGEYRRLNRKRRKSWKVAQHHRGRDPVEDENDKKKKMMMKKEKKKKSPKQ